MKRKIGVAALLALLALGATAPSASAQCGGGLMIKFDADCWAYETSTTLDLMGTSVGVYQSNAGSTLSVVGIITLFCGPLAGFDASDPNTEYTMYWTGLSSAGTVASNYLTTGRKYDTDYSNGTVEIWQGSPRNAPTQLNISSNPPGGSTVPANFTDGNLFLSGTIGALHTTVTRTNNTNSAIFGGSFNGTYTFTGGSQIGLMSGYGTGTLNGLWCGKYNTGCTPPGYTAHPSGKFDIPPTAVHSSTWGAIKQLYR